MKWVHAITAWFILFVHGLTFDVMAQGSPARTVNRPALATQANRLASEGRWREALPLRRQIVTDAILTEGPASPFVDDARHLLVDALVAVGEYEEALKLVEQSLAVRIEKLGPTNTMAAWALSRLGEIHSQAGNRTEARAQLDRALEMFSSLSRPAPGLHATALHDKAMLQWEEGDWSGAESTWTLAIQKKIQAGQTDSVLGHLYLHRGDAKRRSQRFAESAQDLHQAKALIDPLPSTNRLHAELKGRIASLFCDIGNPEKAVELLRQCVSDIAQTRHAEDQEGLVLKRDLARALHRLGDTVSSLQVIEEALAPLRNSGSPMTSIRFSLELDRADRLTDLGSMLALEAYESALSAYPREDDLLWAARERLAMFKLRIGDLEGARVLLTRVLTHRRQEVAGGQSFQESLASTLLEASRFERELGRFEEANSRLGEAFQVLEMTRHELHPIAADLWNEAALLADLQGHDALALKSLLQAELVHLKRGETNSLALMQKRMNLAWHWGRKGSNDAALAISGSAVAWLEGNAPASNAIRLTALYNHAVLLHRAGRTNLAGEFYRKAYVGMEAQMARHAATVARDWVFLERALGNTALAKKLALRADELAAEQFQNVLRFAPERTRLTWQQGHDAFSALAATAASDPIPLAESVLRRKGIVLDSIIEDHQHLALLNSEQAAQLKHARASYYRLVVTQPGSAAAIEAKRKLEAEESALAAAASTSEFVRLSGQASLAKVREALPAEAVLLEFVRYQQPSVSGQSETRFGVLIIGSSRDASSTPRWVDLGAAEGKVGISTLVNSWQKAVHREVPKAVGPEITAPLNALFDSIWRPLAPYLPASASTVIVAPDGDLNFVPFAALWTGTRFLGEERLFRYVASGRDLLAPPPPAVVKKNAVVVYDVAYQRSAIRRAVIDPVVGQVKEWWSATALFDRRSERGWGRYDDLPFAAAEGMEIVKLLKAKGFDPVIPLTDDSATEEQLLALPAPYILHFATHGQVLADWSNPVAPMAFNPNVGGPLARDPMLRSWVVLSRGNETLAAWEKGSIPDPFHDGMLTAGEASLLHLKGTWLVTLSACNTGLGPNQSGEGVFGLRRAFTQAGARHVLLTLWPVSDKETGEFMTAFYQEALQSGDAPGALARTQRNFLRTWRTEPQGNTAAAARLAGPFILSSRGL